jgi:hypothetical protein
MIRGLIHGSGPQGTLTAACLAMGAFAVVGLLLGHLAGRTVRESVQARVAAELEAEEQREAQGPKLSPSGPAA